MHLVNQWADTIVIVGDHLYSIVEDDVVEVQSDQKRGKTAQYRSLVLILLEMQLGLPCVNNFVLRSDEFYQRFK